MVWALPEETCLKDKFSGNSVAPTGKKRQGKVKDTCGQIH